MKKLSIFLLLNLILITMSYSQQEARLLRFPTTDGDKIVFTYAGQLYLVPKQGGTARQLTTGDGYAIFPRFSPDGKWLAFTGQYDGNTEVYLMPANGGTPKRLTYTATLNRDDLSDRMGPNNIVIGWTPDSKYIIYRSRKKSFNDFVGQLFLVSIDGGLSTQLPLSTGGFCSYSIDGKFLAFNRVFREFRTWKYYRGGMADDIRIFNFDSKEIINITNNEAQDIIPMWIDDEIYFISDRDRTMNLFVYNTKTKETSKVTNFDDYDIKFPSHCAAKELIVFEKGGFIYTFDTKTKQANKVSIFINQDLPLARIVKVNAADYITSFTLSPGGERLGFSARGDIFSVPATEGVIRNLTKTSGVHERNVEWSPDGKYLAYLSDETGEFEIYIQKHNGSEPPIQLTKNADTYYFELQWSPDSKKLLFSDKKLRLRYVDIETKNITEVAQSQVWEYNDFTWSPDSRYIAYCDPQKNDFNIIRIYDTQTKETYDLTDMWYDSHSPHFSADGKYLYFVSERDFNPIYSRVEWNYAYQDMSKIYLAILDKSTPNPLAPKNDDLDLTKKTPDDKKEDKKKKNKEITEEEKDTLVKVIIDIDGLKDRIVSLPIDVSTYWNLQDTDDKILYQRKGSKDEKVQLFAFDLKERKETKLGEFDTYLLSIDKKKILVKNKDNYYVLDFAVGELKPDKKVPTQDMIVWIDKKAEWQQIFYEAWRQMRDFFYVPNMHGLNWEKIKNKYEVFLPYIANKHDLNYIIGEMIGELSIGHAYVGGGDVPTIDKIYTGLLGAELSKDTKTGYFKIDKILDGANWSRNLRSPLQEIQVNAKVDDYIISIDNIQTNTVDDIYKLLIDKANKQVEMLINNIPSVQGARRVIVVPIADETALYYYNWVQNNIKLVNEKTNGQVGYIHIPDMGVEGLNEFVKYFYPQLTKKALIIDDRGNGGGNVSPMILERLLRVPQRATMARNVLIPGVVPAQTMIGPKVLLFNQYSASDGDLFPYGFKKYNIGKTIGVRSWGGVVGIRGSLPFVDGTYLNKPEFASYSIDESKWIIEGHGVEPDIVIDNDPYREYLGIDDQLLKAIEVIMEELQNAKEIPNIPTPPDKSK
ncbi:MAG TPA: S41 family peptidase [Bacteroidales bacterium]|nr:protease [Bacteroidales bacterium]HRC78265.1 S41 family peptidase [Bacteroidales bacterium]